MQNEAQLENNLIVTLKKGAVAAEVCMMLYKYFSLFYLIIKHFVRALRKFHLSCV
tara:strand:+ start:106 stop:270 length:165 start_codon:yes stop_codon:yes gene_type:complete